MRNEPFTDLSHLVETERARNGAASGYATWLQRVDFGLNCLILGIGAWIACFACGFTWHLLWQAFVWGGKVAHLVAP